MIVLSDIKNTRGPNPGGSITLHLLPWQDVENIPEASAAGVISSNITSKEGKQFAEYEFLPGKCKVGGKSTGNFAPFFGNSLEVSISGDEPDKLKEFEDMLGGLFIAIVEQASGRKKVLGNMLCPLHCFEIDWQGGGEPGDLNGATIKFASRGGLPKDYTGQINPTPPAWRVQESSAYCITE